MTTRGDIFDLEIGDVPPSLNRIGTRGSRFAYHRAKKKWEGYFTIALLSSGVPKGLAKVEATATCRFHTRHKRDEGNYRWMLEKALGDALQINGCLDDDSSEEFTFGKLRFEKEPGVPRTIVTLEVLKK